MAMSFDPRSYLNLSLIKEPMNWAIIFVVSTIWLMLFHTIVTAWQHMMVGPGQGAFGGPGQIAAPTPDVTQVFATTGLLGGQPGGLDWFQGGAPSLYSDQFEGKYAEDGWFGNP